jgi:hypothetical protein
MSDTPNPEKFETDWEPVSQADDAAEPSVPEDDEES